MFKLLVLLSLYKQLIKLGGNAVDGVLRIQLLNIKPTVLNLLSSVLLPIYRNLKWDRDIFYLGSTGKKPSSGDIDIAIDYNSIKTSNNDSIDKLLFKIFKSANSCPLCKLIVINQHVNDMIHISFPQFVNLTQTNGKYVQIDILLTKHKLFTKFFMYSPTPQESMYKGAHRNELLKAILTTLSYKPIQKQLIDVMWRLIDINSNGLYLVIKTIVDLNGNRLKYLDTDLDLLPAYGKVLSLKTITNTPQKAIDIIVGKLFTQKDIDTFLKLFNIISYSNYFNFKNSRYQILRTAALALRDNLRLLFPELLIEYLD